MALMFCLMLNGHCRDNGQRLTKRLEEQDMVAHLDGQGHENW